LFQYALIFLYFGDDRFKFLGVLGIKYTDKIVITIFTFGKPAPLWQTSKVCQSLSNRGGFGNPAAPLANLPPLWQTSKVCQSLSNRGGLGKPIRIAQSETRLPIATSVPMKWQAYLKTCNS
jgi:hypothetical protein